MDTITTHDLSQPDTPLPTTHPHTHAPLPAPADRTYNQALVLPIVLSGAARQCSSADSPTPAPLCYALPAICSAELLLVLLPSRSAALYQEVKLASDAALGLPSQVLVAGAAGVGKGVQPRGRLQYCANLGLKINAKMGGVNVRLAGNPDQVSGWENQGRCVGRN